MNREKCSLTHHPPFLETILHLSFFVLFFCALLVWFSSLRDLIYMISQRVPVVGHQVGLQLLQSIERELGPPDDLLGNVGSPEQKKRS